MKTNKNWLEIIGVLLLNILLFFCMKGELSFQIYSLIAAVISIYYLTFKLFSQIKKRDAFETFACVFTGSSIILSILSFNLEDYYSFKIIVLTFQITNLILIIINSYKKTQLGIMLHLCLGALIALTYFSKTL
jgi:hypothetical protein